MPGPNSQPPGGKSKFVRQGKMVAFRGEGGKPSPVQKTLNKRIAAFEQMKNDGSYKKPGSLNPSAN